LALSAAAAHVTGAGTLETAARFLLLHAPALIALAALSGTRFVHPSLGRASGFALALGLGLFSGDLALRAVQGVPLFPHGGAERRRHPDARLGSHRGRGGARRAARLDGSCAPSLYGLGSRQAARLGPLACTAPH